MPHRTLPSLSLADAIRAAGLGAVLLMPLANPVLAHETSPVTPAADSAAAISGPFIDIQALNPDPRLRNAPAASTQRLTQATGLSIGALRLDQDDRFKDIKVLVGRAQGPSRLAYNESNVVVTTRSDGSFIALLPNATIRGDADGRQTLIPAETGHSHAPGNIDYEKPAEPPVPNLLQTRDGQRSLQIDRNAQGETVIDLLAGFSQAAADYIGDHEAYALAQVASVNHALRQSLIDGVRLRLVGTQVIAEDHPITSGPDGTMRKVSTLFAEGMRQYSPDLVTGFFVGTPGVDTMLGWGNINGRYSINNIKSPTTFRHEVGHNIGGDHCSDGSSDRFGYHNGRVGTILCGNHVGYYSNPDVRDNLGVPLGQLGTANMARLWREGAQRMSAYSPAVIPMDHEEAQPLLSKSIDLRRDAIHYEALDIPEGTERLALSINHGPRHERAGKVQLLLKHGARPSVSDYDYRTLENHGVALGVNHPKPGRWYVGVRAEKNKSASDQLLEGHVFAKTRETSQARYLRFVATSSINGSNVASIAELLLADAKGKPLPRSGWRVHSVNGKTSGIDNSLWFVDGKPSSYWSSGSARYPHEIIIDLGAERGFSSLNYLPRQNNDAAGNIKGYEVYGGDSPTSAWALLAKGEFSADNEVKSVALKPVAAIQPPVAVISGRSQANADERVQLDASGSSDPQGRALSFAWHVTPALDFELDGARISFSAPRLKQDTRYRFTLSVDNGQKTTTAEHSVTVLAPPQTAPGCTSAWNRSTAYLGGQKVSHNGRFFLARWWTQGQEPGNPAFTGPDFSGKVWSDLGPCH
ncbi:discoidin domain-containing protein [Pseudomonas sp. BC42]|uniref:discoidin domain-containing protein n=1 Tax=Pseudomonas sp. BC42 TaxID=2933816 RepID=UPI001F227B47|nr:discoidin domain-containing protein [Pseudomonas sp. BC42]ULT71563.1 discoidin domain-containing protein [Pseudomonas sp. BC42]